MAEFIWFYGASGAGKASLINKIADGQFKLPGVAEAIVCQESLDFGRTERVDSLEKVLGKYAVMGRPVLIKGQAVDLTTLKLPQHLQETYPQLQQHFVLVYTRPDVLPQRVAHRQDKYWPNPEHDFIKETKDQATLVTKLCAELNTQPLIIDNSGTEPHIKDQPQMGWSFSSEANS